MLANFVCLAERRASVSRLPVEEQPQLQLCEQGFPSQAALVFRRRGSNRCIPEMDFLCAKISGEGVLCRRESKWTSLIRSSENSSAHRESLFANRRKHTQSSRFESYFIFSIVIF